MMDNTLKISKNNIWKLLLPIFAGAIISLIIAKENVLFLALLAGLVFFTFFVKNPELPLAIQFNGTFIYFYAVYKMGFETSTLMTGIFYGFLALSYLLGGILLISKRPQKFKFGSIDVLFICIFFLFFVSYFIFSLDNPNAFKKISYAPLLVIAPYFGVRFLNSEERIKKFFKYCVLVAAILIISAIYELLFNPVFAERGRFSIYMFSERGDNPILFGITFAILLIILFVRVVEQRKLKFKYLILMVPSAFLLLRSGSRGAVISFLVTMVSYLFIMGRMRLKTKVYAIILLSLLILGVYKFIPESTTEFYQYTFTPEARENPVSSVYQRLTMWGEAIDDFKRSPILGVGTGNSVGGIGFPHNIILEISAELGILGLFLFLAMCYLTIRKSWSFIKKVEDKDFNLLMKLSLLLFIYSLVEAMFSGYITNQTHLFMSMGLIVSMMKLKANNQRRDNERKRTL